ncbi:putative toxin-antitoxin system toxin component, PIN family [Sphingomonas sp. CL5.1]|uniref:putative toxin-antitoxin system toxin component, PIN family n=1 Tax=Sphingomonas sp. CL5.1 TaxID=2653203 RepID=UPI0015818F89|nr:putative toxin-antitoxin system toxin component, PIN family [Sphingomonas sp. CL5.1]QKS00428.1 putative toxin-antitoxin system toxin component, PIN family [Sphingomonas sp. CL5.1]
MRVILDTNVLLSGLISPSGGPSRLIDAWLDHRFTLISHAIQLDEFREVSRRDKIRALLRPAEAGRLLNQITLVADMPDKLPPVQRSRDPRDDFLLGLCEAGGADWLVTGDKDDLLSLDRHGRTHIVTVAKLLAELALDR